jgi:H+/Cl- antiporter ClcA
MNAFRSISLSHHIKQMGRWCLLSIPVALITGSLVALFLWLLDTLTLFRFEHTWLLYLLPLAGVLIHFLYKWAGKNASSGNNLILNEIHQPGAGVPVRMAPLVLVSTWITHLFGGSAGREGTAVQMGGSMAAWVARWLKLAPLDTRVVLLSGVSAGFGAVFGTPVAGAIFALEVLASGVIKHQYLLPCLLAGLVADFTCAAYGIHHTKYSIAPITEATSQFGWLQVDLKFLGIVALAGLAFGATALLFTKATHSVQNLCNKWLPFTWLHPVVGGLLIIFLSFWLGNDYLGLGVFGAEPHAVTIASSFQNGGAETMSWFWKLLFTAITLGSGFKGGEVTPLFFMGAALGNTLGLISGVPVDLMAGLGFIAVFAGATNTPIACTLMGVELFGGSHLVYYLLACGLAYLVSGKGIYSGQRTLAQDELVYKQP